MAAAAAAVLLGESGAAGRVRLVAKNAEENVLRAERDAALARTQRLETELAQVRAELAEARYAAENARGEREGEVEKLLKRLREQGVQLRQARDAVEAASAEAERGSAARALSTNSRTAPYRSGSSAPPASPPGSGAGTASGGT